MWLVELVDLAGSGELWAPGLCPPDMDVAVLEVRQSLPVKPCGLLSVGLVGFPGERNLSG